jgi:uncharacterized protein (TIGR02147 family)
MNKFQYLDYKALLAALIKAKPTGERGLHTRLARHMQVHTTFLTHVLKGKHQLSNEQALKICDFFAFRPLETDFFLHLVQWNRAGNEEAKAYFGQKVSSIRDQGLSLKEQLQKQSSMTTEDQAIFYSDWTYSAVRLATALPEGRSSESISKILNLPYHKVTKAVDFLLKCGLCKVEGERLTYSVFSTYVDAQSPFAKRLHDNWRLRSIQHGPSDREDVMYSSAVTLTKKDFLELREVLVETLKKFEKVTDESEPRILAYLNLDWIKVT